MSGKLFYDALVRLGYNGVDSLDSTSLDWLFEEPSVVPVLEWFCDTVQPANLITLKEQQEFDDLKSSPEGILEGDKLETALNCLSLSQEDDLSKEKLQEEIRHLEESLSRCSKRKQLFLQQRAKLRNHHLTLSDRLERMDRVEASAKKQYTHSLQQSQMDNTKMNDALEQLTQSVQELSRLYRAGGGPVGKDCQEAVFLSQVNLEPYYLAEEKFTQELTAFTKKQFFEGIADVAGTAQGSQYELLEVSNPVSLLVSGEREGVNMDDCKELGRLQLIYPQSESARINASVENKSTSAACQYAEDRLRSLKNRPYPQNIKELSAKLQDAQTSLGLLRRDITLLGESEVPSLIRESSALHVTKVLRGDYMLKIARQDYFTTNQDKVIEQLVLQRARNEYLTMAYELELKCHRDIHRLLTAAAMMLQGHLQASCSRMIAMEEAMQVPSKYQRGTIDSRDKFMTRLYQLLDSSASGQKHHVFPTYQELVENADKLHHQMATVKASLDSTNSTQEDRLSALVSKMKMCQSLVYGDSATASGVPNLSPAAIFDSLTKLDDMLTRLEEAVLEIIKEIDGKKKKLKTDPLQVMERDLFVNFFNNPPQLRKMLSEVTARLQALLIK